LEVFKLEEKFRDIYDLHLWFPQMDGGVNMLVLDASWSLTLARLSSVSGGQTQRKAT